jgi:hypothetical protein
MPALPHRKRCGFSESDFNSRASDTPFDQHYLDEPIHFCVGLIPSSRAATAALSC